MSKIFDWDSPIENDGDDFILFPSGTLVQFEVKELTKSRSEKKQCPMAVLEVSLMDKAGKFAQCRENLVLHQDSEWRLCAFFKAIGQRKKGIRLIPNWTNVLGAQGYAKVLVETWTGKDGTERKSNKIDKYLDPEEGKNIFNQKETKDESENLAF